MDVKNVDGIDGEEEDVVVRIKGRKLSYLSEMIKVNGSSVTQTRGVRFKSDLLKERKKEREKATAAESAWRGVAMRVCMESVKQSDKTEQAWV